MANFKLDTVLSSTSDHNYILDVNGNFSYANKPMLQFLNLPFNELVGKSHFDLTAAAEVHNAVKKVLKTAEKHNGEVEYTFHSGEKRYYEYVCTPVLDDEKKIKAVTVAERDITKRKRAEEEKEKLEVQNRLLQKAESLSRMAGAIAHHFNNKLQVVMGHLEMAMRQKTRKLNFRNRTELSLADISMYYNPVLRGWLAYYGRYYRSAMYPVFRHFNKTLVAWAMRKYKRLKGHKIRASRFIEQIAQKEPHLFVHWQKGMVGAFA